MPANSVSNHDISLSEIEVAGSEHADVLRYRACDRSTLAHLLGHYGLGIEEIGADQTVPGSYWGDEEAGLIGNRIYVRADTPVHSVLHEACHFICMDPDRRAGLHTNAGGDYDEENAVCYLQILLAGQLPDLGINGMWRDMDQWGYTFRLGSAQAWYEQDASDAFDWLLDAGIVNRDRQPSWNTRTWQNQQR